MIKKTASAFGLILCCLLPVSAQEQEEDEPEDSRRPRAEVRGWIPKADSPVQMALIAEAGQEPKVLAAATAGNSSVGEVYQAAPPGRVIFNLQDTEDKVLATATGTFRDGSYYTAVAWPEGGRWQIKVFADTAAANAQERALRIVNFPEGRETLLDLLDGRELKVPGDTVAELKLPARVLMTTFRVLAADGGPPAQSTVELNLASAPAAYVVVGPDYRGRMRPRILGAGPMVDMVEDGDDFSDEQR